MTAQIERACQDLDKLLTDCLVAWNEDTGDQSGMPDTGSLHGHYMARARHLVHARSALYRIVNPDVPEFSFDSDLGGAGLSPVLGEFPLQLTVECKCSPIADSAAKAQERGAQQSGSRPDRPSRRDEGPRGNVRDWNRDVFGAAGSDADGPGCVCGEDQEDTPQHSGASKSKARQTVGASDGSVTAVRESTVTKPAAPKRGGVEVRERKAAVIRTEPKEVGDGEKTKSTRSNRRG